MANDVLFRYRLRVFATAAEPGDVRAACSAAIASGNVEQGILPYALAFPWSRRRADLGRPEAEQVVRSQDVDQRHLVCASRPGSRQEGLAWA